MDEEAGVAKLTDFSSQELDSLRAVAEDDRLRDVQLGEQGVQTVQLFPFLQERVVLGQTLQRQLIRDLDVVRLGHVTLLELTDLDGVGRAEQADLAILRAQFQDLLHDFLELSRDEPVNFVEDAQFALIKLGLVSLGQVENSTRSGHDDVNCLPHSNDIFVDARASRGNHALDALVLAELLDHERRLHGQLSYGHQDEGLNLIQTRIDLVYQGDAISCSLACAILGLRNDVFAGHDFRDCLLLNGRWKLETHLKNALQVMTKS